MYVWLQITVRIAFLTCKGDEIHNIGITCPQQYHLLALNIVVYLHATTLINCPQHVKFAWNVRQDCYCHMKYIMIGWHDVLNFTLRWVMAILGISIPWHSTSFHKFHICAKTSSVKPFHTQSLWTWFILAYQGINVHIINLHHPHMEVCDDVTELCGQFTDQNASFVLAHTTYEPSCAI